ncbi:hypothetical protein QUB63_11595 [Microcoleus sp. ARI1-B5]|uniref:hypothetical protein n=1 Tax=unclassified Microcoleus TaxID=2642155 RepID=UPI002FD71075
MKLFYRLLLTLVLCGVIGLGHVSKELTALENKATDKVANLEIDKVTNMASQKANNSNQVKQDGLHLEITGPEIVALSIPENKPGATAPLSFTVSVTNNTQAPIPFIDDDALIPEIFGPSGQALRRREPINRQAASGEYHRSSFGVGKQTSKSMEGRLSWQNNVLQLMLHNQIYDERPIDLDKSWFFDTLGPGEYQIRFTYETPIGTILYPEPVTFIQTRPEIGIEVTGTSHLVNPLANFRLIQPVGLNNSAVEVDGIRFETFIPEPLLTVPNQRRNTRNSVQIGMRITNNTPTPFYFSFYATFTPDLVMPDGQVRRGDYGISDWMRGPEESDFLLVKPGKSLTFFPGIDLSWRKPDKFSLLVHSGYGGLCHFDSLKPGIYHLRFRYENTSDTILKTNLAGESIEIQPIEKVWTGRVDTPFVEFRLIEL